jgi:hypothetical protein
MSALWVVAVLSLMVALAAWLHTRRTARRLAEITQLYWQLKFEHGELKARIDPPQPAAVPARETFVPLSSIKKS